MTLANTPRDVTLPDNLYDICDAADELDEFLYSCCATTIRTDSVAYFNKAVAKFHELATAMGYRVTPLDAPEAGEFVGGQFWSELDQCWRNVHLTPHDRAILVRIMGGKDTREGGE